MLRFQSLEVLLQWFVSNPLVFFFLFFYFFCNHAFIVIMRSHPLVGFFYFYFFNHVFIVSKVQKASCSARYGENKTYKSKTNNKGKSRHQLNIHYREGFSSTGPLAT